jgi:hypothetical protein
MPSASATHDCRRAFRRGGAALALAAAVCGAAAVAAARSQPAAGSRLLLAFASTRGRAAPPYPAIFFYEHDGVGSGRLLEGVPPLGAGINNTRADMHPALSGDGRMCAFSAQLGIKDGARVEFWDRKEKRLVAQPTLNDAAALHRMHPSLSADGKLLAFTASSSTRRPASSWTCRS